MHPVEAISDQTIGAVALLSNSDVSSISFNQNIGNPIPEKMSPRILFHSPSISDQDAVTELLRRASGSSRLPHKGFTFSRPATRRSPYPKHQ
jgi:hypothetical protein